MLCGIIVGPTWEEVLSQVNDASLYADLLEFRLDLFTSRDARSLDMLLKKCKLPVIFTLRSKNQGGNYQESEEKRLAEIRRLAACHPAYFDVECTIPQNFLNDIALNFPEIRWILSFHDFKNCPTEIEKLLKIMPSVKNSLYKLAVTTKSTSETLSFLCSAKKYPGHIYICMGEYGEISRIIAPMIGSTITYACLAETHATAPGQLSLELLTKVYRYKSLRADTALYGLIGNPITGSISEHTHNVFMESCGINAVYVKLKVEPDELITALEQMKHLGFRGLSVTMPFKEKMLEVLERIDPEAQTIGSVNTLILDQGKWKGYNTDGIGALDCLEMKDEVKDKHILLIGAGGAARAIAFEAKKRYAHVTILNRTKEKAVLLAKNFNFIGDGLDQLDLYLQKKWDMIIKTIPGDVSLDLSYQTHALPVIMDITTKPMHTPFLARAKTADCPLIYGYEMFIRQALKQFHLWFPSKKNKDLQLEILENQALKILNINN